MPLLLPQDPHWMPYRCFFVAQTPSCICVFLIFGSRHWRTTQCVSTRGWQPAGPTTTRRHSRSKRSLEHRTRRRSTPDAPTWPARTPWASRSTRRWPRPRGTCARPTPTRQLRVSFPSQPWSRRTAHSAEGQPLPGSHPQGLHQPLRHKHSARQVPPTSQQGNHRDDGAGLSAKDLQRSTTGIRRPKKSLQS